MFFIANTEKRLSKNHPLHSIKRRADEVPKQMLRAFNDPHSETVRPGIPPETLLKALLLQALYLIPSERWLVETIGWNLLYRWSCDIEPDAEMWDATALTHNRERFERHGAVQKFFECVVAKALTEQHASDDHFTVGGTLIQSWASLKSFRPKHEPREPGPGEGGGNPSANFRGQRRTNETYRPTTDPEARLARKNDGQPTLLWHSRHAPVENRRRLWLDIAVAEVNGHTDRNTAKELLRRSGERHGVKSKTVSADRGCEAGKFLRRLEENLDITSHVVITGGKAAEARRRMLRRMKTKGYALGQRARKKIEQIFG